MKIQDQAKQMKLLTAARNGDNGAFRSLYQECKRSIPYTSLLCLQSYLDSLSCFASYETEAEAECFRIFEDDIICRYDPAKGMSIFSFFRLKFDFLCRSLNRKLASIKEESRCFFVRYDENDAGRDAENGGSRIPTHQIQSMDYAHNRNENYAMADRFIESLEKGSQTRRIAECIFDGQMSTTQVAKELGISRQTVYNKIKEMRNLQQQMI